MVLTSIHAWGAATTTSAWPKPSFASISILVSAAGIFSRTRSSPVTPRCAAPAARCWVISPAERNATSTPGSSLSEPR